MIPKGANYKGEFYGSTTYYKRVVEDRPSSFIDDVITYVSWFQWEKDRWESVGSGFSSRRLVPIADLP